MLQKILFGLKSNFYCPCVLAFVVKKAAKINKKSHKDRLHLLKVRARAWNLLQMVASYFLEVQHFLGILSSKMKSTHGKPMCGVYLWHRVCVEIEEMDNPYAQLNNLKKSHVYDFWIVQACIHIGCCTSCVVLEIVMVPTMCFWTTSYSRSEEALCTTGVSKRHQTLKFSPKHWSQYYPMQWQEYISFFSNQIATSRF